MQRAAVLNERGSDRRACNPFVCVKGLRALGREEVRGEEVRWTRQNENRKGFLNWGFLSRMTFRLLLLARRQGLSLLILNGSVVGRK